jgi:MYXO-CTERM domain-containing protein
VEHDKASGSTIRIFLQEARVLTLKRSVGLALLLAVGGLVSPVAGQTTDQGMATRDADDDGFDDWGLLGLLGLAGLLGRGKRDRDVVETRRV